MSASLNAVEPGEASLLTALYTRNLAPHSENPETSRFVGGAQQVSIRTATALGNRVIVNAAVRSLKHSGGAVVADTAAGAFRGRGRSLRFRRRSRCGLHATHRAPGVGIPERGARSSRGGSNRRLIPSHGRAVVRAVRWFERGVNQRRAS
jgi:hypothetical protein